jgi:hypothetical protein
MNHFSFFVMLIQFREGGGSFLGLIEGEVVIQPNLDPIVTVNS